MYSSKSGTDGVNVFRRVSHVLDLSLFNFNFTFPFLDTCTSLSISHTWLNPLVYNAQQHGKRFRSIR
jgi:hypothetical protein